MAKIICTVTGVNLRTGLRNLPTGVSEFQEKNPEGAAKNNAVENYEERCGKVVERCGRTK